jgi:ribonuclease VapC
MSGAALAEAYIVAEARQGREAATDLAALLADLDVDVVPFDEEQAEFASSAWRRFGKGRHPAGLNLGDTFSYALAASRGETLLFKGKDFAATDIPAA